MFALTSWNLGAVSFEKNKLCLLEKFYLWLLQMFYELEISYYSHSDREADVAVNRNDVLGLQC
ncbi:MAG: hypothetical protein HQL32_00895 [Planctomycetes bacterium]|nr:hypothetical protein [Planctomycetota bacterium]